MSRSPLTVRLNFQVLLCHGCDQVHWWYLLLPPLLPISVQQLLSL